MEGLEPVVARPAPVTPLRRPSVFARVRDRLRTTPGQLTLISVLALAGAVCFAVATRIGEAARAHAAAAVHTQIEPLLVQSAQLYAALSDADATATTTFLTGGLEPAARRQRYLQELQASSTVVTALSREVTGPDAARAAVASVATTLPLYSGMVETARAENRQGLPVGEAYMRQASHLVTETALPAAKRLFNAEAARLSDGYQAASTSRPVFVVALVGSVALALLVAVQLHLHRISRRVFNIPILLATVVLVLTCAWTLVGLTGEQRALAQARRDGSDPVELMSVARALVFRAQTDQSLALVNRGSDETDPLDHAEMMTLLGASSPLVAEVAALERRAGRSAASARLSAELATFRARSAAIDALQRAGELVAAAKLASAPGTTAVLGQTSSDLADEITAAQARFDRSARRASQWLAPQSMLIPLLSVLSVVLIRLGLEPRLREYQ